MRFKQVGSKRDMVAFVIHNAEATASILNGSPVCMYLTGGAGGIDGIDVVLPSTAHTQNSGNEFQMLYGVALTNLAGGIPPGGYGEAQVTGFCPNILFNAGTRSAVTGGGSWSSIQSVAAWLPLIPETVGNAWTTYPKDFFVTGATNSTANLAFPAYQVLLAPFSVSTGSTGIYSFAASATNVSDTRTALTTLVKGYVRIL